MKPEPTRALLARAYDALNQFPNLADLASDTAVQNTRNLIKTTKIAREKLLDDLAAAVTKAGGSEGPNLTAARATLAAMDRDGRGAKIDRALVVAFTQLAAAVDANPTNANLWRRYLDAAAALTTVHDRGTEDDKLTGLLDDLFSEAEDGGAKVGNAAKSKPQKPRATGSRNGSKAGPALHAVAGIGRRRGNGATA